MTCTRELVDNATRFAQALLPDCACDCLQPARFLSDASMAGIELLLTGPDDALAKRGEECGDDGGLGLVLGGGGDGGGQRFENSHWPSAFWK